MFLLAAATKGLEELKTSESTEVKDDDEHGRISFPLYLLFHFCF